MPAATPDRVLLFVYALDQDDERRHLLRSAADLLREACSPEHALAEWGNFSRFKSSMVELRKDALVDWGSPAAWSRPDPDDPTAEEFFNSVDFRLTADGRREARLLREAEAAPTGVSLPSDRGSADRQGGGRPFVLAAAGGLVGRLALERPELQAPATEVLRDLAMCDEAGKVFAETRDWRALYEADQVGTWKAGASALEGLYQQIHKLRVSLIAFVDSGWATTIRGSSAYEWYSAKEDAAAPSGPLEEPARELAWIDHLCTMRNRAVQHRVDRGSELAGYIVEGSSFSAVYKGRGDRSELGEVRRLFEAARLQYGVTLEASGSTEDVAYLSSLAEQLHDVNPPLADEMRRAIIRSGVVVLLGSESLVRHLDAAFVRIVSARFC